MRMIVLAAAACLALATAHTQARAEGGWCAVDADGCSNCSFQTRAQCQATVAGSGGSCAPNPAFASAAARARKPRSN
jgi:Protein of unknown function (DUF3551)